MKSYVTDFQGTFEDYKENNWVDRGTVVVVIEQTLFDKASELLVHF